jgi:UDP-N-acetylglucosamine:LPS N-acetylglucosamine transferase
VDATRRWRALVVYSRVGGGHLSAARAIASELELTGHCTAKIVDAYRDCGRFPVSTFPGLYTWLARHPHLWSAVYNGSDSRAGRALGPSAVVGPFLRAGFLRLMDREQPDLVVSVLPAINGLLGEVTRPRGIRLEVVLTDWHAVHPFWEAPGVDYYTAPTESARADCISFGADPATVEVVGIPVRRQFASSATQSDTRKSRILAPLELDPARFTILSMVGAEGSPRALRNLARLAQANLDAQLVVMCGRNARLRRQIERLPNRMLVKTLGFVENVADLMRASDVLVTKAGGLTLAEAFCCAVPVVIHDLLPGQEVGNLEYVQQHHAAAYAPSPVALAETVTALFRDRPARNALAACGAALARPEAAPNIAADLLARLNASASAARPP